MRGSGGRGQSAPIIARSFPRIFLQEYSSNFHRTPVPSGLAFKSCRQKRKTLRIPIFSILMYNFIESTKTEGAVVWIGGSQRMCSNSCWSIALRAKRRWRANWGCSRAHWKRSLPIWAKPSDVQNHILPSMRRKAVSSSH